MRSASAWLIAIASAGSSLLAQTPGSGKQVFDSGALMAADSATGKPLWSFQTSQSLRASPMTYLFDNQQLVALASGSNILVFGLMD